MDLFFEIKYLELNWYNENVLTKVTESLVPLNIEYNETKGVLQAETTIYPKIEGVRRGVLAVRYLNNSNEPPYILLSDGRKRSLSPIVDPDMGNEWWMLKDQWDDKHHYWRSIAPNIVGSVKLVINDVECELLINGSDFNIEQLERYLRVFKNDLWELIVDDSSVVNGRAKGGQKEGIGLEAIKCIESLVSHAQMILKNPKVELREIQSMKSRKEVRPVKRTFMELSTKANSKLFSSRDTAPSYNVPENRYVLFALQRCYRIIKHVVSIAKNKSDRYQQHVHKFKVQHEALVGYATIDPELAYADLNKIKNLTDESYWQSHLDSQLSQHGVELCKNGDEQENNFTVLRLKFENEATYYNGFFFRLWHKGQYVKPSSRVYILKLSDGFAGLRDVIKYGMELEFVCQYNHVQQQNKAIISFENIRSIKYINSQKQIAAYSGYQKLEAEIEKLSNSNWIRPLTKKELEEQQSEKEALENRIAFYERHQNLSKILYEKTEPKLKALKLIIKQLKDLGVKPSSIFPNSMTFVQNPHYQAVHNNYKTLRNVMHLEDDNLLVSLEKIDEIGLVNMPLLYERWTLIQIILMLKNLYRFEPQDDWKYSVINAIKTSGGDTSIKLENQAAKRSITLSYEKALINKKIPDFTIELTWFAEADENFISPFKKKFILDSKFYDKSTFMREGGLLGKINELYEGKNYSEDGQNAVFLVHPCKNALDKRLTAQDWGKYSFLGESDYLSNGEYYAHSRGAIYLNPVDDKLFGDELQRLLGMLLQYNLDSDMHSNFTDRTHAVPICIRCGSHHLNQVHKPNQWYDQNNNQRAKTSRSVYMSCSECNQMQVYNHCSNKSHNGRIIKNGIYWSYHSAHSIEKFNMKCPQCGSWGGW